MAQPRRRYKLVSWDHQKNVGLATDGSAYEGEPILFTVRGADLDPAYDGRLDVGEVFMADESPNFLLFDVLIEDGPRGLVSQENYKKQSKKVSEAIEFRDVIPQETKEQYESRCLSKKLSLDGKATDHIWAMEDVEGYIGLRMDCGDAGTVYLTPKQARDVISTLQIFLDDEGNQV